MILGVIDKKSGIGVRVLGVEVNGIRVFLVIRTYSSFKLSGRIIFGFVALVILLVWADLHIYLIWINMLYRRHIQFTMNGFFYIFSL